ncbi:MAG: IclR family transcriptional regulator [Solirubrobacteraceae bacterium]
MQGAAVLECFAPDIHLLGIVDIAAMTGMSKATAHRYAATLVALGFLEQPANGGRRYRLAPKAHGLGLAALDSRPLRAIARPHLEVLRARIPYTVSLGVLDDDLLVMDRLPSCRGNAKLKLNVGVGSRLPTYCTSMGKVLLAYLSHQELEEAVDGVIFERWGPNTITTKQMLYAELEQVAAAGFAVDDEELTGGARSIAVPVHSKSGVVAAAIEITAPTTMIQRTQMVKRFGPKLLAVSRRIARELDDEPPFVAERLDASRRVRCVNDNAEASDD